MSGRSASRPPVDERPEFLQRHLLEHCAVTEQRMKTAVDFSSPSRASRRAASVAPHAHMHRAHRSRETEGSNPVPSSGETGANLSLGGSLAAGWLSEPIPVAFLLQRMGGVRELNCIGVSPATGPPARLHRYGGADTVLCPYCTTPSHHIDTITGFDAPGMSCSACP
jgi:hypothetical protein